MAVRRFTNPRADWVRAMLGRFPSGLRLWADTPPSTVWRGAFLGSLVRPDAPAWAVDVAPDAYASLWPQGGELVELRSPEPPAWHPVEAPPPPPVAAPGVVVSGGGGAVSWLTLPGLLGLMLLRRRRPFRSESCCRARRARLR